MTGGEPAQRAIGFDLDGTLLRGLTVSETLAAQLGRVDEIAALEARYARGEISNAIIAETTAAAVAGRCRAT